jgi:hypothetical protein
MASDPKINNQQRRRRVQNLLDSVRSKLAERHTEIKKNALNDVIKFCLAAAMLLMGNYIEFGSYLFLVGLIGLVAILVAVIYRFYIFASIAFLMLLLLLPLLSVALSSFLIASDEFRFRYGETTTASYVEFPSRLPFLRSALRALPHRKIIDVISCGDKKVARLPSLPYAPLYEHKNILGNLFGFRRLPPLRFESIEFMVGTVVGTHSPATIEPSAGPQSVKPGNLVKFTFGFTDSEYAVVSVTELLPRSVTCLDDTFVPLIPILEVLPWEPEESHALIEAVVKIDEIRGIYENAKVLSLDAVAGMRLSTEGGQYKALLDFFAYSLLDRMISGNVLAETRADIVNRLCYITESKPHAFLGPFASLKEYLNHRISSEFADKYEYALPACHVPSHIFQTQSTIAEPGNAPFLATFRRCLQIASSVTECLAHDDATQSQEKFGTAVPLASPSRRPVQVEFDAFDQEFSNIVATDTGTLIQISSVKPSDCPILRDKIEDTQFVDWWIWDASKVMGRPFICSSLEWKNQYARSKDLARDAIFCGKRKGIRDDESTVHLDRQFDWFYQFRCHLGGQIDAQRAQLAQLYAFVDKLDDFISKLKRFAKVIDHQRIDDIVRGFEMMSAVKRAACGEQNMASCAEEYARAGGLRELNDKIPTLNLDAIVGGDLPEFFNNLERLNNSLVNIALCDILQDSSVRDRVKVSREEFCDSHGLGRYRLISPEEVGRAVHRTGEPSKGEPSFEFERTKRGNEYMITVPNGN